MIRWRSLAKTLLVMFLVVLLGINPLTTDSAIAAWGKGRGGRSEPAPTTPKLSGKVAETAPPVAIEALRQELDNYQPQVKILSPKPNTVLTDDSVSVQFQVRDLPIFKDAKLGLGPHIHVLLDNHTYQAVYDLNQPLIFKDLDPGTHTIRAFASRPWHESFKNEGAYAQVTFHVYTKTQENSPSTSLPLLTYSRPQGSYGAEPIMLDFYLTNAPLHLVAQENNRDDIADWRIRCTVNGESFILDRWQPLYLKGFKPGKNWVQLEFLDEKGQPVRNVFNNTARVINYEPNGKDTLSRLVRGELAIAEARAIIDPNYVPEPPAPPPAPIPSVSPTPTPSPSVSPTPSPSPITPSPTPVPTANPTPSPDVATPEGRQPAIAPVPVTPVPATPTPTTRRRIAPKTDVVPARPSPSPLPTVTPSPTPSPAEVKAPPTPTTDSDNLNQPTPAARKPSRTVVPSPVQPSPTPAIDHADTVTPPTPTPSVIPSPEVAPVTPSQKAPQKLPDFLNRLRTGAKTTAPPIAPARPRPTPTDTGEKILEKTPAQEPGQPANGQGAEKSLEKPSAPSPSVSESAKPTPRMTPNITRSPSLPTAPKPQPTPTVTPNVTRSPALKPTSPTLSKPQATPSVGSDVERSPQSEPAASPQPQPTPTLTPMVTPSPAPKTTLPATPKPQPGSGMTPNGERSPQSPTSRFRSVPDIPKSSPVPDQVTAPSQPEAIPVKSVKPEAIAPVTPAPPTAETQPANPKPTTEPTAPNETRSPSRNANPFSQFSGNDVFNRLRRNFDNLVAPTASPDPGRQTSVPIAPASPVEILPAAPSGLSQ